ncbi:uncharacterized protein A1O9_00199 [Exophiala aquamarina CBS 119918]|uniref:Major facilitator superfamily (MFS) profile domain-containing protein n=1 Tax=Exophiala aquamarina CBS 119918 TaxID=1182545 RepID=A0A072PR55_9EURO|nr:uncharacterized protein A1O9_00199 [Exophiala aquamarina CBS 119918]KEF62227.1 hypothetical protein A1O9_00199 [Exophiala aquamarina CBS 119918]
MTGDEDGSPSERSPLLHGHGNGHERPNVKITGPALSPVIEDVTSTGSSSVDIDIENNADGEDLARTSSIDSHREAQFTGNADAARQMLYIVPAVSVGVFLAAADQTIIVSSYGRIGSELDALNLTSWVATAYFLTLTSFQPLYGKLSDIWGRKACLLSAYTIFGMGCLFCGLARDINQLIAARVFQGVGGGGMTTVVSILFSDIVPLKDRGMWQGIINIVYAAGAASGAPFGGLVADYLGWRWSFLGQVPLCIIAFLAVLFSLHLPSHSDQNWRKKLARIDFLGAIVLVAAVFGLIFGMDRGSNTSWVRPITYGPIMASVGLFGLFIHVERHLAKEPFAPGHIIFNRTLIASYLCCAFSFGAWLSILYYLPLFYQAVDGFGATGAAVRLLPAIVAGVSGSLFSGMWIRWYGRYYWLTVSAYVLLAVGMAVILLFSGVILNNTYIISVGTVLSGFGNGIGVTSALIAIISNANPKDQAVATACSYLFRSLGSVIGISLSATAIQQRLRDDLAVRLGNSHDAAEIEQGVRRSLDYLKQLTPELRHIVRLSYGTAATAGFLLALVLSLGATLASVFIKEQRISR